MATSDEESETSILMPDMPGKVRRHSTPLGRAFSPMNAGSMRGSIFALTASAVGAGILSLPLVLKSCGMVLGLVCITVSGLLAFGSLKLLVQCGEATKIYNYSRLVEREFGSFHARMLSWVIVVYTFGAIVSYLIVIGTCSEAILHVFSLDTTPVFGNKSYNLVLITMLTCFPLSLKRELSSLRFATLFSVVSMFFVTAVVFYRCLGGEYTVHTTWTRQDLVTVDWSVFQSITICFFAYTCHINVFSVYDELHDPLMRRMLKVAGRSVVAEIVVYSTMALSGFLMFRGYTPQNILDHNLLHPEIGFHSSDYLVLLAKFAVVCALIVAFPLNMHPMRKQLNELLWQHEDHSEVRHWIVTTVATLLALVVAIEVPSVSTVFGLLGASCCIHFCFILPVALYTSVFRGRVTKAQKCMLFGGLAVVIVIGMFSIGFSIKQIL